MRARDTMGVMASRTVSASLGDVKVKPPEGHNVSLCSIFRMQVTLSWFRGNEKQGP